MAVPKRKVSRSRRDMRSANKGLDPKPMVYCHEAGCDGAPKLPHEVCSKCGFYRGKKVMTTKLDRSIKRNEVRGKVAQQSEQAQA